MKFSVIIPTRDRPRSLAACLESFRQMYYPRGEWELIVVDDGGKRSLTSVKREIARELPLRSLTTRHAGPASARNAGARVARGEFIAFTDDDCRVTSDWLHAFERDFANGNSAALGGQCITPFIQRSGERAWQHLVDFLYQFMRDANGSPLLIMSNNAAYRREVFEKLGGFDESFPFAAAEDMELSYRLLAEGHRQGYCPEAKVWHYHKLTAVGHVAQQFRYGRGGFFFSRATKKKGQVQQHVESYYRPKFYSALLLSLKRAHVPLPAALLVVAGQIAYQIGIRFQAIRTYNQELSSPIRQRTTRTGPYSS